MNNAFGFIAEISIHSIFLKTLLFFWFFHVLRRTLFLLYFWQLKEYRLDRFLEEVSRRKEVVFSKFFFLNVLVLLAWLALEAAGALWVQNLLVFGLVLLYFLYSFYLLVIKKWRLPAWTKKIILFFTVVAGATIALAVFFWSRNFLLFLLLFEIFFLALVFFCLQVVQFPVFLTKKTIIKKAKSKIENMPDLVVVGITGSFGKTTTKEMLFEMLSRKYKVLKTKDHTNTEIGVAKTVLSDLTEKHSVFVCEMAAYKRGEIKAIAEIVKPKIGVLTGINQQHLALFGSQENIIKGKYELIEALPGSGVAFFNAKNRHCRELYKQCRIKKILYGQEAQSFGEENLAAAVAVAKEIGMTEEEVNLAKKEIKNKLPGVNVKKGINNLKIIDASYSSNPDGVMAHLDYLKSFSGKKIIIMPCLIELGDQAKQIHIKIGQKIAKVCDLAIIVTSDFFQELKAGAIEQGIPQENIILLSEPGKILEKIKSLARKDEIILLEGRVPEKLKQLLIE